MMKKATGAWVYKYFDALNNLLYVGQSAQPFARLEAHKSKDWARRIKSVTMTKYATSRGALKAERDAIKAQRPAFNFVHMDKGKKFEKIRSVWVKAGANKWLQALATIDGNGWARVQLPYPYGHEIFKTWRGPTEHMQKTTAAKHARKH